MRKDLFDFNDYKLYLASRLRGPEATRGTLSRLASAIRCQPAFLSRVLSTKTHLSQEHAIVVSDFFGHSDEEAHYFMLLLLSARSGTAALTRYYGLQLRAIREKRREVTERIQAKSDLAMQSQARYYQAWYHAAVHMLLLVPGMDGTETIASRLQLPKETIQKSLNLLCTAGLAIREGERYRISETRLHLPSDSPFISKHHSHWRVRAINSFDTSKRSDLHFSGPMTISVADAGRFRAMLLDFLSSTEPLIKDSPSENLYCLCVDWFEV